MSVAPDTIEPVGEIGGFETIGDLAARLVQRPEYDIVGRYRALLELRHAQLRVQIALSDIEWAGALLTANDISPAGALEILDCAVDRFVEGIQ